MKQLLQDKHLIQVNNLIPHVLSSLMQIGGFDGLKEIIDIAEKDSISGLQIHILEVLIQMRVLQRLIIIPSILAQLNSN